MYATTKTPCPPWIINVGGAENYSHGIDLHSACLQIMYRVLQEFTADYKNTTHYWIGNGI